MPDECESRVFFELFKFDPALTTRERPFVIIRWIEEKYLIASPCQRNGIMMLGQHHFSP
jgi:hypothetical protein